MVIVSPYAKPGYTDSTVPRSPRSLAPTSSTTTAWRRWAAWTSTAYDYRNTFNYSQAPLGTVHMVRTRVSGKERRRLAADPPSEDDPT